MAVIINLRGIEGRPLYSLLTQQIDSIPNWSLNNDQFHYISESGQRSLAYMRTEAEYFESSLSFYLKYRFPEDAIEANEWYHVLNSEFKAMLEANFGEYIASCELQDLRPNEFE